MNWVYLSPHFDDAALSCGAMIWQQLDAGDSVQICTVCAGLPSTQVAFSPFAQSLHARWQTPPQIAVEQRRAEDENAGTVLGAVLRYWNLPDCIYRTLPDGSYLVNGEEDLYQPSHTHEAGVVTAMQEWLRVCLTPQSKLVVPMTLGGHVDHRLVRTAAEGLARPIYFYADFPYVEKHPEALPELIQPHWHKECIKLEETAVERWCDAIACYTSQISTFWKDTAQMRIAMHGYAQSGGGACLWFAE